MIGSGLNQVFSGNEGERRKENREDTLEREKDLGGAEVEIYYKLLVVLWS